MAEVIAVPAASVILLREAPEESPSPYEVLMIRRHQAASFVPDAWVFPGGALDADDETIAAHAGNGSTVDVMKVAALRELFEETGVWLGAPLAEAAAKQRALLDGSSRFADVFAASGVDLDRIVWTSRWITPDGVPKRFDTYFFVAAAPDGAQPSLAAEEAVEFTWTTPEQAIATLRMVFPTIRNLEANLREHGLDLKTIPYALQFNKRDLPTSVPLDEMYRILNFKREPTFEAVAPQGVGVFDTLKAVAKLILIELRKR